MPLRSKRHPAPPRRSGKGGFDRTIDYRVPEVAQRPGAIEVCHRSRRLPRHSRRQIRTASRNLGPLCPLLARTWVSVGNGQEPVNQEEIERAERSDGRGVMLSPSRRGHGGRGGSWIGNPPWLSQTQAPFKHLPIRLLGTSQASCPLIISI